MKSFVSGVSLLFLFPSVFLATPCILRVYFVCLLQTLLIYLLCLPIKKKKKHSCVLMCPW